MLIIVWLFRISPGVSGKAEVCEKAALSDVCIGRAARGAPGNPVSRNAFIWEPMRETSTSAQIPLIKLLCLSLIHI